MLISDYIAELEAIRSEHGELEVWTRAMPGPIAAARVCRSPEVTFLKEKTSRKQWDKFVLLNSDVARVKVVRV